MADFIMNHYYEIAAIILFGIGFMTLLLHSNLIKKVVGLNIMDTAIYLFLASRVLSRGGKRRCSLELPCRNPGFISIRFQQVWY